MYTSWQWCVCGDGHTITDWLFTITIVSQSITCTLSLSLRNKRQFPRKNKRARSCHSFIHSLMGWFENVLVTYMTRWFSTTQIIIIHTGQIIMNQTHGMDHFDGHGGRHGPIGLVAKHVTGGQTENGANTLATGHERILHGLHNLVCLGFGRNQRFIERLFYQGQSFGKVILQIKLRLGRGSGRQGRGRTAKRQCRCRRRGKRIRDANGETDEAKGRKAHLDREKEKRERVDSNRRRLSSVRYSYLKRRRERLSRSPPPVGTRADTH